MNRNLSVAIESECHRIGISGCCNLLCPALRKGECDEQEAMLEGLEKTFIGRIVKFALENYNDPALALVDYYEEKGSAVAISYVRALQIVETM